MSEEKRSGIKRPRDEEFEPERASTQREEPIEDAFDRHRQKPAIVLAIVGAGVLFAVVAILVYTFTGRQQHTVINVITPETTEVETVDPLKPGTETLPENTESGSIEPGVTDENGEEGYLFTKDDLTFRIVDSRAVLVKCESDKDTIYLPSMVDGCSLTQVAPHAFDGCTHLFYVQIPEGVWHIGEYAFANIGDLREICLPTTLKQIDAHCFDYTGGMTFISLQNTYAEAVAKTAGIAWEYGDTLSFTH